MGARSHEDLIVWQLATRLRNRIYRNTSADCWERDRRFRDQFRDAAAAVPANVAEGFGRFAHADFARFLRIARGSLREAQTHMDDARARGYWDAATYDSCRELSVQTMKTLVGLLRYLLKSSTPDEAGADS